MLLVVIVTCDAIIELMVKGKREGTRALLFLRKLKLVLFEMIVRCKQDYGRFIDFLLQ